MVLENDIRKQLTKVKNEKNETVTNEEEVLKETVKFYKKLYKSQEMKNEDICTYKNGVNITKLSECDSVNCEGLLTPNECKRAVQKNEKE